MDSTTLRDWNNDGRPAGYYIPALNGFAEVGEMDPGPSENDDFDLGLDRTPNISLYAEAAIVETFGDMTTANKMIRAAGGNVWQALKMVESEKA